jgi:hypothetical protein
MILSFQLSLYSQWEKIQDWAKIETLDKWAFSLSQRNLLFQKVWLSLGPYLAQHVHIDHWISTSVLFPVSSTSSLPSLSQPIVIKLNQDKLNSV